MSRSLKIKRLLREIGAQTKEAVEAIGMALDAATANNAQVSMLAAVAGSWHNHYETCCKGQ